MANNRMFLVNKKTGATIGIAKYYPSTGWYTFPDIEKALNDGFHESDFGHLDDAEYLKSINKPGFGPPYSNGGNYGDDWELRYEIETKKGETI